MVLNTKTLAGVPVETRGGQAVGKVVSFDLEVATGRLYAMHVQSKGLIAGLMEDDIIVAWDAIIEMSSKKVVIADGVVKIGAKSLAQATSSPSSMPNPSLMKEG